ncbi:Phosphotyrosyl phosphate activator protein-domain-containing protein [Pisolithus tinctorius]|nr:Phosphotyrosyl phosphate activator protein-domain-containing protein [Pisolithus tinctorius]
MHNLRSTKTTSFCYSLRSKAIHDNEVVDEFANDYMYFACIRFINSIKAASLRWQSLMLDDVSAIKTREKVSAGMIQVYAAEVLGKPPVIQHFPGSPPPSKTGGKST